MTVYLFLKAGVKVDF